MIKEIDIKKCAETGNLGPILSWLRTNIHQHGKLYWPDELIKKITGEKLNSKYLLEYLEKKYLEIYI